MRVITRMRLLALVLVLICVTPVAHAQRRERTVDGWRPLHYEVSLSFNDQLSEISSAKTDITIEALKPGLNKIDLDFGSILIDSVLISNKATRFERTPGTLNVILLHAAKQKERIKVTVVYHGRPQDGLVFANDRDGKPSATGDNWPNRVHQWIPSLDHPSAKATVAFNVSAPQREIVVANGKLMNLIHNGVFSTWRYEESKPIPPYCMVVVVNEGARLDVNFDAVPLSYYVPQKDRPYAMKGFSSASSAVSLFSQTIAPYPYEKLALIVGATRFGGMENSSAIVFTSTLFDQRTSDANAPLGRANGISPRFGIAGPLIEERAGEDDRARVFHPTKASGAHNQGEFFIGIRSYGLTEERNRRRCARETFHCVRTILLWHIVRKRNCVEVFIQPGAFINDHDHAVRRNGLRLFISPRRKHTVMDEIHKLSIGDDDFTLGR